MGGGGQNPKAVADGDAELGISLISDIKPHIGKGVDLLGPLPSELQYYIVKRAGVGEKAKDPQAAKELIDFLRSPTVQAAFRDQGLGLNPLMMETLSAQATFAVQNTL